MTQDKRLAALARWCSTVARLGLGIVSVLGVCALAQAQGMATPGSASVGPGGTASYAIPIAIPPGIAGLSPKLSLEYSSQGRNSLLGVGWNLSGLSAITRCGSSMATDGIRSGVNYTPTDRFCMDGQRLILSSGTYGAAGSLYRTELDSFSQVTANGAQGVGPASFTVKTKAGLTLQYGTTSDSAVAVLGSTTVRLWALNKVSDSVGNFMTVAYTADATNGSYYPASINYTGNGSQSPSNSVAFAYSARADQTPLYTGGAVVKNTQLLSSIKTYANAQLVKTYQLGYKNQTFGSKLSALSSVQEVFADGSTLPVTQINWPGYLDFSSACAGNCGQSFATTPISSIADTSTVAPTASTAQWQMVAGDLTGDGRNDLVGYLVTGATMQVQSWMSNGAGSYTKTAAMAPINIGGDNGGASLLIGDLNGDGIPDLVIPACDTSTSTNIAGGRLSVTTLAGNGDGSFGTPKTVAYPGVVCNAVSSFRLSDQNGTGQSDLLWVTAAGSTVNIHALLNNGVGGFTAPTLLNAAGSATPSGFTAANIQPNIYWMDMDNDGIPDMVLLYMSGNSVAVQYWPGQSGGLLGSPVTLLTYTGIPGNAAYTYANHYKLQLVDVNGDGAPDLMAMGAGPSGASADIWMNTGGGHFSGVQQNVLNFSGVDLTKWTPNFADVNGDGIVDIVYASANAAAGNQVAYVFLGNGNGTFTQASGTSSKTGTPPGGLISGWNVLTTDISGSGRTDLLAWNPSATGMYVQTWTNAVTAAPTLLSSVNNGVGVSANFAYSTLSNTAVYTKGGKANYPQINLNIPLNVVSSVTSPDGVGGTLTTNYQYSGLRAEEYTGRGVLGFASMTTTQQQGANTVSTTSTFGQGWPFTGLPLTISKTNSAAAGPSHQTSLITNIYDCLNTAANGSTGSGCVVGSGKTYFPYAKQTVEQSWDLDGTVLPTLTSTNSFDGFGNALVTTSGTGDGYSKTTANTYTNDTANWFLGRLNQSTMTTLSPAGSAVRSSAFTYSPTTGLLLSETIEPTQPPLCQTTSYTYDGYGNKTGATTANCTGASGTALFASRSSSSSTAATTANPVAGQFVTNSTNALGQSESHQYDARFGQLTSLTGPNGLTTAWSFDALGRPLLETRADGNQTKTQYLYCAGVNGGTANCPTINGAVAAFVVVSTPLASDGVTPNGAISRAYVDALGRKIRTETQGFDGSGSSTAIYQDTQYNNLGQVVAVSRPYYAGQTAYWNSTTYDALGRAVLSTQADSSTSSVSYSGLVTTSTNAKGQTSITTKNSQAQVVSVKDANSQTTQFVYDPLGNLTTTTDVAGNIITLTYDLKGRKTQMVDPDMGTWSYTYDALGQLVGQTDAKGNATTMTYDVLGRMTQRSEADLVSNWYFDKDSTGAACTKGVGKLCQATTSTGYSRKVGFDSLGRVASNATTLDTGYTDSVTYDANGRVATRTYPGGVVVQYSYTALGYLQSIKRVSSGVVLWKANTLDAEGHLLQQTLGNGLSTTQGFNAANGRITSITTGAGNAVQNATYQYDTLGNVTNRNDQTQSLVETFGYDNLNRMQTSTVNASAASYTDTFAYANSGNISSRSDLGNYSYQTVSAAATQGYVCASGTLTGTGTSSTCVITTTTAATVTYSCPTGQTLQANNTCLSVTNVSTPANANYTCTAPAVLNGSNCVTTTTVGASVGYTCPSNATLSGTNCVFTQSTAATPNYSCAAGTSLSGSNCLGSTTVAANVASYSCPSGYSLSGSTCFITATTTAIATYSVNSPSSVCVHPYTYNGLLGCIFTFNPFIGPSASCALGTSFPIVPSDYNTALGFVPIRMLPYAPPQSVAGCLFKYQSYTCPVGQTVSGASCLSTTSVAATPVYACSSGTLSGSSCIVPTSVAATVASYSCPAGQTASGNQCINTTTSSATANYSCTSGALTGSGTSSTCVTTATTSASLVYFCTSGTLQGTQCLLSNNTYVPANSQYVCSTGTLNANNQCVVNTSVAANASYSCPTGQTVSGAVCVTNGVVNKLPHALSLVSLTANVGSRFYSHDANGNRISELWQQGNAVNNTRSYSYTSFNMAKTFAATANGTTVSETYGYGPEHQRVKQVSTTLGTIYYLNPGNSGDLFFEKEIKPDNSVELRSYVSAGGGVVAEIKQLTSNANVTSEQTRYFQRDSLGSTNVVTDEAGVVLERLAYEPFGKRRQANGPQDPSNTITDALGQRGFTNHEHMEELGLINMNGRVYDPMTARFISADPTIEAPMNSQGYNRYSYIANSPLNATDPSGYCFICDPAGSISGTLNHWGDSLSDTLNHWGDVIRTDPNANMVVTVAIAYYTQQYVGVNSWQGAAAGGFAGGAVSSGGDLNAGAKGAATALMFYGVGTESPYKATATQAANPVGNVLGHAAVGCISATMSGGDCGSGAVSAGIADYASNTMPGPFKANVALGTAYTAIVGGTTSVIAGGKFENGAKTAAFGYLFNELMHQGDRVTAMKRAGYTDGGRSFGGDGPIESICLECDLIGGSGLAKAAGAGLKMAFSGGTSSVFWSGYSLGALDVAGGLGTTLESTVGGRFLSWVDHTVGLKVPDSVWNWASSTFANNAQGTAQAVIRADGRVWTTVEKPILQQRGIPIEYH